MHGVEAFDVVGEGQLVEVVERGDGAVDGRDGVDTRVLRPVTGRRAGNRPGRGFSLCVHSTTLTDSNADSLLPTTVQPRPNDVSASSARGSAARTFVTDDDQAT